MYAPLVGEPAVADAVCALAAEPAEGSRTEGNRLLVLTGFWSMLAASVTLWWFNTLAASITDLAGMVSAADRITGMAGGFVLLVQVLMMSRVSWLEDWVGAHDLMTWHRQLGGLVLVAILAHTVLIIYGYALASQVSAGARTWTMLSTYEDMTGAFAATGILVAIAVLAIRSIRRRMSYERWCLLHLATYLVLLLGYDHQFTLGSDLQSPVARDYWTGLYGLAAVCLVWGRVVEPMLLNLRHRLRVAAVVPESSGMFSVYVEGRRLPQLEEAVGDHTTRLRSLRPGTRVCCSRHRRRHCPAALCSKKTMRIRGVFQPGGIRWGCRRLRRRTGLGWGR